MTYDEIVKMWEEDTKIDSDQLAHESLKIPLLQGKYFNFYCKERAFLLRSNTKLKQLKMWKKEYFLGIIPMEELAEKGIPAFPRAILKIDIPDYIEVDDEVIEEIEKVAIFQTKVDFLKLCVDSLNARHWLIKGAIDFLKFKHGIL